MGRRGSSIPAPASETPLTGERMGLRLCLRQDWYSGDTSTGYSGECNLTISPGQLVLQHAPVPCPPLSTSGLLPSWKQCSCCTPYTSYFTPGADIFPGSACACPFQHSRSSGGVPVSPDAYLWLICCVNCSSWKKCTWLVVQRASRQAEEDLTSERASHEQGQEEG